MLYNISNGVAADTLVNVDETFAIDKLIVKEMVEKSVAEFIFRKKNQAITFDHKSSARMNDESVPIDPQLLSRRLVITASQSGALQEF